MIHELIGNDTNQCICSHLLATTIGIKFISTYLRMLHIFQSGQPLEYTFHLHECQLSTTLGTWSEGTKRHPITTTIQHLVKQMHNFYITQTNTIHSKKWSETERYPLCTNKYPQDILSEKLQMTRYSTWVQVYVFQHTKYGPYLKTFTVTWDHWSSDLTL